MVNMVMATITHTNTNPMIDMHCHILPDVDDGSQDIETSIQMIQKEISDGVTDIILTPHVQSRVTKASREEHIKIFESLKEEVKSRNLNVTLHLGAEVHYREHLKPDYKTYTLGESNAILIEFPFSVEAPIAEVVTNLIYKGFQPIVAHIERYDYLSFEDMAQIKRAGALLQVNTNSILGLDPKVNKAIIHKLLKYELIDMVASDAHNTSKREPNLRECYDFLKKQIDPNYLEKMFNKNQQNFILQK